MVSNDVLIRLLNAFPHSFINNNLEFIAHRYSNTYFILSNCNTELDVKCKVLEWLSRAAHKSIPYTTNKSNEKFHQFMSEGINNFLHTAFTKDDFAIIYDILGNSVRHELTVAFVESDYDMTILVR